MSVSSLLGALLVLLCCFAGSTWGGTCDFTFPSGHYYNLNALAEQHPPEKPASVTVQYNGGTETYLWAPCNVIPEATCSGPTTEPNAGLCQQGSSNHNIGVGPTPTWTEGKEALLAIFTDCYSVSTSPPTIQLQYSKGDDSRSSQITITCEPSGGSDSGFQADEDSNGNPEHPPLHYNLKWSSAASWACPQSSPPTPSGGGGGSGGLSGGWIFIIV